MSRGPDSLCRTTSSSMIHTNESSFCTRGATDKNLQRVNLGHAPAQKQACSLALWLTNATGMKSTCSIYHTHESSRDAAMFNLPHTRILTWCRIVTHFLWRGIRGVIQGRIPATTNKYHYKTTYVHMLRYFSKPGTGFSCILD